MNDDLHGGSEPEFGRREKTLVLVAEDNQDDAILTERALERAGFADEIIVLRDGVEVLDYLLGPEQKPLPQLVLLDLKLPRVHGLEVLQRIRSDERTRNLIVVVLTSSDEKIDFSESHRFGADSYVRKTVDFLGFCEMVRRMGPAWLSIRSGPAASKDRTET